MDSSAVKVSVSDRCGRKIFALLGSSSDVDDTRIQIAYAVIENVVIEEHSAICHSQGQHIQVNDAFGP